MRLEAVLLANYAEQQGPLLTVVGGGWEHTRMKQIPGIATVYLCGILARYPDDMADTTTLELLLYDPSDALIVEGEMRFGTLHMGTAEGVPARAPFAAKFDFEVDEAGVFRFVIARDGREVSSLPFEVQHPPD
jgi:uncharacterized protein DUF6941